MHLSGRLVVSSKYLQRHSAIRFQQLYLSQKHPIAVDYLHTSLPQPTTFCTSTPQMMTNSWSAFTLCLNISDPISTLANVSAIQPSAHLFPGKTLTTHERSTGMRRPYKHANRSLHDVTTYSISALRLTTIFFYMGR